MKVKLRAILILAITVPGVLSVPSHAYSQGADPILDVAWSPNGDFIARAFASGAVEVVGADSGQPVFSFAATLSLRRTTIVWNPIASHQLAAGIERNVYVWDITTGVTLFTFLAGSPDGIGVTEVGEFTESIYSLVWTSDGSRLASLSLDGILRIWDMPSGAMTLDIDTTQTYSLDWSPDGTRLYAGSGVAMRVIDATTGEFERLQDDQIVSGVIPYVDLSPDGTKLAGSTIGGDVMIWDVATGQIEFHYVPSEIAREDRYVQWSPDSNRLASAGWDGTIRVWDRSGNELSVIQVNNSVYSVDWSPDGTQLAYGGDSGMFNIISAPSVFGCSPTTSPDPQSNTGLADAAVSAFNS